MRAASRSRICTAPLNLDAVIAVVPFVEYDDGFAVPTGVCSLRP
jgi:hypothetical protein